MVFTILKYSGLRASHLMSYLIHKIFACDFFSSLLLGGKNIYGYWTTFDY